MNQVFSNVKKFGQLGNGKFKYQSKNVETEEIIEFNVENLKVPLEEKESIIQIEGSENHTAILTSKRRVFFCGHGNEGQLGLRPEKLQDNPRKEIFNQSFYGWILMQ